MTPQYLGAEQSDRREIASLAQLRLHRPDAPFHFSKFSVTFARGYSQDTLASHAGLNVGQAGSHGLVVNEKKTRRLSCPKHSKPWSHSASLPSLQPAHSKLKKNTLSQIQHRSRLSQHTPANTNNSVRRLPANLAAASETSRLSGQEALAC